MQSKKNAPLWGNTMGEDFFPQSLRRNCSANPNDKTNLKNMPAGQMNHSRRWRFKTRPLSMAMHASRTSRTKCWSFCAKKLVFGKYVLSQKNVLLGTPIYVAQAD
jgi:hypothetical protein